MRCSLPFFSSCFLHFQLAIHLRVLSISYEKEPTHRCLRCNVEVFLHVSSVISSAPQSYRPEVHRFVTLTWNLRIREVSKPGTTLSRGHKPHLLLSVILECNEWTSDETTTLKYDLPSPQDRGE